MLSENFIGIDIVLDGFGLITTRKEDYSGQETKTDFFHIDLIVRFVIFCLLAIGWLMANIKKPS